MQIALSSWTFHDSLYRGAIGLEDVPRAARELGFAAVELQDLFLWPRGNLLRRTLARLHWTLSPAPRPRDYALVTLNRLQSAINRSGVGLAAWDIDTDWLSSPAGRTLAYTQLGLRAARRLGASILRITAGTRSTQAAFNPDPLVQSLGRLCEHAGRLGLQLALENHNDALGDPAELASVVRRVGRPELGVCLDFGNFAPGRELDGVRQLAPLAVHAHAKCWAFDGRGEETRLPYAETLAALKAAGFDGTIAVEFEGDGDPGTNAWKARELIERHW